MGSDVVLKEIKGYHPDLPVIILTSQTYIKLNDKCIKPGAADYISKPYIFDELFDSVIDHIR